MMNEMSHGLLFILSAPAGTGKTTLVQMLTKEFLWVAVNVSYTTRRPRRDELDGVHYHFISKKEFLERIDKNEFLEYVELYGQHYGTAKAWVKRQLEQGKHVFLVIDTQGALHLKSKEKENFDIISIFLAPPSLAELEKRLKNRKADSEEVIKKRLEWAETEMNKCNQYDYLIINDTLSNAYEALRSILIAEEHRVR